MKNLLLSQLKLISRLLFVVPGVLLILTAPAYAGVPLSLIDNEAFFKPENKETVLLARRGGCGQGEHQMGCEGGGKGRHRGGRHGMMHHGGNGPGLEGDAQCPQPRSTAKAPESLYNATNPLENSSDNIEKGRLLFQLDAQPSCTMCHGSGNGLGMMAANMTPPPRNFTCKETMEQVPDGQLFWIIKNGSAGTGMPAFDGLADRQVWQLIHYIRQLSN